LSAEVVRSATLSRLHCSLAEDVPPVTAGWPTVNERSSKQDVSVHTGWSKKTDTQIYFGDNFSNSAPILTILSLLQAEIHGA